MYANRSNRDVWARLGGLAVAGLIAAAAVLDGWVLYHLGRWEVAVVPILFALPPLTVALVSSASRVAAMYATAAIGVLALTVLPYPPAAGAIAAIVIAYSAASRLPRPHNVWALPLVVVAAAGGALRGATPVAGVVNGYLPVSSEPGSVGWLATVGVVFTISAVVLAACWLAGTAVRARRDLLSAALDRAVRLERERAALDQVAAVRERTRIARELHDVVAHSLSVVVLQADGALAVMDRDQRRAAEAMEAVGRNGRRALAELRHMLGVLRDVGPASPTADTPADGWAPQPGLGDIEALADRVRQAGVAVIVSCERAATVSPAVGLSAYRIVQESLTNAVRHAGTGATVRVSARVAESTLVVDVTDDGRGTAPGRPTVGPSLGITGMRERARAVGGTLQAGPQPHGGFRVTARLPASLNETPMARAEQN